jgi:hypothetical protein
LDLQQLILQSLRHLGLDVPTQILLLVHKLHKLVCEYPEKGKTQQQTSQAAQNSCHSSAGDGPFHQKLAQILAQMLELLTWNFQEAFLKVEIEPQVM